MTPAETPGIPAPVEERESRRRTLFRPEVYGKHGASQEGAVAQLRLPGIAWLTWVSVLILAAMVCLLYFGHYARRETVGGIAVKGLGTVKVYAPVVGMVVDRLVDEGAIVKSGDPLFVISTDKATVDAKSTQDAIRDAIESRKKTFAADLKRLTFLKQIEERNLRQSLHAGVMQEAQITREIEFASARVRTARLNFERYQTLVSEKYVVESYLLEKELDLQNQNVQLEALVRQRQGITRDNESLRNQIAGLAAKASMDLAEIERNLEELNQQLADTSARKELVVTAQAAGVVSGLMVDKGAAVSASSVLLSIQAAGEVRDVQLFVPSRAIGFVKPGTPVMARFDAFPYQKFGQYPGRVTKISAASIPRQEIPFAIAGNDDYFRVFVEMEKSHITAYGQALQIQNGMKLEADMILDDRRLYEWVIEPILSFTARL